MKNFVVKVKKHFFMFHPKTTLSEKNIVKYEKRCFIQKILSSENMSTLFRKLNETTKYGRRIIKMNLTISTFSYFVFP